MLPPMNSSTAAAACHPTASPQPVLPRHTPSTITSIPFISHRTRPVPLLLPFPTPYEPSHADANDRRDLLTSRHCPLHHHHPHPIRLLLLHSHLPVSLSQSQPLVVSLPPAPSSARSLHVPRSWQLQRLEPAALRVERARLSNECAAPQRPQRPHRHDGHGHSVGPPHSRSGLLDHGGVWQQLRRGIEDAAAAHLPSRGTQYSLARAKDDHSRSDTAHTDCTAFLHCTPLRSSSNTHSSLLSLCCAVLQTAMRVELRQ